MDKVIVHSNGCWLWTSTINYSGYAYFWYEGSCKRAHRVIFEHFNGKIESNYELDHLCSNRNCVNPFHLEKVSHKENVKRGRVYYQNEHKTHCPYGHSYSGDNLAFTKEGWRRCRACGRRKYYERKTMRQDEWEKTR